MNAGPRGRGRRNQLIEQPISRGQREPLYAQAPQCKAEKRCCIFYSGVYSGGVINYKGHKMSVYSIHQEARQAYKDGEGQEANPYPLETIERVEWGMAMQECQQEEFNQLMGGFA
jgi:hypothetical protein